MSGYFLHMNAQVQFSRFIDAANVSQSALMDWFDSLPAVPESLMLGEWQGGCFNTGHSGEKMLGALKWLGKRFSSRVDVFPLICANEQGERVVNPVLGAAQLREVAYRGVVTATMVYDTQPIFDHFRKIDENTVLGVMDKKGENLPLFFYLQRI